MGRDLPSHPIMGQLMYMNNSFITVKKVFSNRTSAPLTPVSPGSPLMPGIPCHTNETMF